MRKEVKINIPMFIGIILIVALTTAILVSLVNIAVETMREGNDKLDASFEKLEGMFNEEKFTNEENENYIANIINNT